MQRFTIAIDLEPVLTAEDVEDALREEFPGTTYLAVDEIVPLPPGRLEMLNEDLVIAVAGPDTGLIGTRDALGQRNEVRSVDGGKISRTDYPELYAICQEKFGQVEGDQFVLPDLRARVINPKEDQP